MAISGTIQQKLGYYANFGLGVGFSILAVLWSAFMLKDSRSMRPQQVKDEIKRSNVGGEHNENKKSWSLVTVFDISNVKDGFRGVFKKRDKNRRFFILLLITSFTLTIFCSSICKNLLLGEIMYKHCISVF